MVNPPIWSPATREGLQVAEFKPDEIFALIGNTPDYFKVGNKDYEINLG